MEDRTRLVRAIAAMLLALVLCLTVAGCGSSGNDSWDVHNRTVTLTVGSGSSPEQTVLGQIYAQALETAGYRVRTDLDRDLEVIQRLKGLKRSKISGYPGHLSEVLHDSFLIFLDEIPADTEAAYKKAKGELEKVDLTAFPPTPFALNFAVGMLKKKAEKLGVETDSDLTGKALNMSLQGPYNCPTREDCLTGLEKFYEVAFGEGFSEVNFDRRYKVLENEQADASMLYTTDGRLAGEKDKFVILEEDKHAFAAGNAIWMTTPKVVDEAGPDYEKAIVEVQKELTLPVMQELDARVELGGKPAAEVAAEYLEEIGFGD